MSVIHVCSLADLPDTVKRSGAGRLVTLLSKGTPFERPAGISLHDHLILAMNDIVQNQEGLVTPMRGHVEALLCFVQDWDRQAPMVVHCFAGVSRSTAAAYIAMVALSPERDEVDLAQKLRASSPTATPNILLIRHADALLGRNGRMIAAIEAIGRGADAFIANPFELAVDT